MWSKGRSVRRAVCAETTTRSGGLGCRVSNPRHLTVFVRFSLVFLAAATLLWSLGSFQVLRSATLARGMAVRILEDQRFKPGTLAEAFARLEAQYVPMLLDAGSERGKALLRLRITEDAMRSSSLSSEATDRELSSTEENVRSALASNPTDPLMWMMLYSVETSRSGYDPKLLSYLKESYELAPLDAWIALRRSRIGLAIFAQLDESTQARVISEFAGMVDSYFLEDAVANLIAVGWSHRERLVEALVRIDPFPREAFAKKLAREGLKVSVPGVELDERWWR